VLDLAGVEERLAQKRVEERERGILLLPDEELTGGEQGQPAYLLPYATAS